MLIYILGLLDTLNDPRTGLWGTNYGASNFSAVAGAFHFYNHYKYYEREIPSSDSVLENVISIQEKDGLFNPLGGGGACEDLDAIDIIFKLTTNTSAVEHSLIKAYFNSDKYLWIKVKVKNIFT